MGQKVSCPQVWGSGTRAKHKGIIRLGDPIPNLEVETPRGKFKLQDWVDDGWAAIFSYPGTGFSSVSTTELAVVARNQLAFKRRGVKLMALSSNSLEDDGWNDWIKDVESCAETKVDFPIIADPERTVSYRLNMLDVDALDDRGRPLNARAIHVIRPDNKIRLMLLYPHAIGWNFNEVLRAIDALQLNWEHTVSTPANWEPGDRVIGPPEISAEEARAKGISDVDAKDLPWEKMYLRWDPIQLNWKINVAINRTSRERVILPIDGSDDDVGSGSVPSQSGSSLEGKSMERNGTSAPSRVRGVMVGGGSWEYE